MWAQNRSNRLIGDREQVKEHILHMQRLRNVKGQVDMRKPPKPTHISTNYKKEMQKQERMSEIQYQNRVLLRKMLQIDLKPSANVGGGSGNTSGTSKMLRRQSSAVGPAAKALGRPHSAKSSKRGAAHQSGSQPAGLNSYTSLNRANRIRSLAKIIDENKILLDKLQNTRSNYDNEKWKTQYQQQQRLGKMIRLNGDRYCRNPYFLHSICTLNAGLAGYPYTDGGSLSGGLGGAASSKAFSTYYAGNDNRTISEIGTRRRSKKGGLTSKASDSNFAGNDVGGQVVAPPRLKKKVRPFSAPRHQGLRSQGLKHKVGQQYQAPVTNPHQNNPLAHEYGQVDPKSQLQYMETVNEQNNNNQYFDENEDEQLYDENDEMDGAE